MGAGLIQRQKRAGSSRWEQIGPTAMQKRSGGVVWTVAKYALPASSGGIVWRYRLWSDSRPLGLYDTFSQAAAEAK